MKFSERFSKLAALRKSRPAKFLTLIWAWQPLTGRGLLVGLLATVAVRTFAIAEFDLVADILGRSALALLALTLLSAVVFRIRIAHKLSADARFDTGAALSKRPIPAGIILRDSDVPAFFSVKVEREFLHPGVISPRHVIRGRVPEGGLRHLIDDVIFPHRGYWEMEGLKFSFEDTLGLSRLTWRMPLPSGIEVGTEKIEIQALPIVASSARAGDELSQSRERAGDLFDIKQYDPSDGVKRILWKTYAKSGQLVVRRPEPAVIPEGELALFLIAGPQDDYVAGALQDYIRQLEDAQITVLFGTDGMAESGFDSSHGFITAHDEIIHAINRCVFNPHAGTGSGFAAFLGALERSQRFIHNAVVFGPESGSWLEEVTGYASRAGVKLHVAIVPRKVDPEESLRELEIRRRLAAMPKAWSALPPGVRRGIGAVVPGLRMSASNSGVSKSMSKQIYASGAELHVVRGRQS